MTEYSCCLRQSTGRAYQGSSFGGGRGIEPNRSAASHHSNTGHINRRSAIPAGHVGAVLIISLVAADQARVQGCMHSIGGIQNSNQRSEERRVGKECRSRWSPY